MDSTAKPFGEVTEIYIALAIAVLDLEKFLQIIVLNSSISAEVLHEILYVHYAIEVLIKCQESFADLLEV